MTSFGIEFQTEEEAREIERSPSVALLCAGLLRRGMVYELEPVCNGLIIAHIIGFANYSDVLLRLSYNFDTSVALILNYYFAYFAYILLSERTELIKSVFYLMF